MLFEVSFHGSLDQGVKTVSKVTGTKAMEVFEAIDWVHELEILEANISNDRVLNPTYRIAQTSDRVEMICSLLEEDHWMVFFTNPKRETSWWRRLLINMAFQHQFQCDHKALTKCMMGFVEGDYQPIEAEMNAGMNQFYGRVFNGLIGRLLSDAWRIGRFLFIPLTVILIGYLLDNPFVMILGTPLSLMITGLVYYLYVSKKEKK